MDLSPEWKAVEWRPARQPGDWPVGKATEIEMTVMVRVRLPLSGASL
jgi:hypothetical protein